MYLALAGGVGGARPARGLCTLLAPEDLTIAVNTGDDFVHCGLRICPDLDTVMYTLAGRGNPNTGWGLAGESWRTFGALDRLGGPAWFRLGDEDLATHLRRTHLLAEGASLSEATRQLCDAFGLSHAIAPMTDDPAPTVVHTDEGPLAFQDYFVRRRCEPPVRHIDYSAAERATPSAALWQALHSPRLRAIIVCPSNPYLSIEPFLSLRGVRSALEEASVPVIVVSPIVGGDAVKGPAAKIMRELGVDSSAIEIAKFYSRLADGIAIDDCDAALAPAIAAVGLRAHVGPTLMKDTQGQVRVAQSVLDFASLLAGAQTDKGHA